MRLDGRIYLVTGERGSGKTTICARVAHQAAQRSLIVAGILTERAGGDQQSTRRVVDLASGKSRLFGSQDTHDCSDAPEARAPNAAAQGNTRTDPLTPGWRFQPGVFAWANEALSRSTPCDLLVIDELGPLEVLGGRGWTQALDILRSRLFRLALVVCRCGLLEDLDKRLGLPPSMVLRVTTQTCESVCSVIGEELSRLCGTRDSRVGL